MRIFILFCLVTSSLFAQNGFVFFKPSEPKGPDTIFYPFYNDVQMIEIDNVGYYDAVVNYHEMTQPRALEWSMLIPAPDPNVYLFRNKSGVIVKSYNTYASLETWNAQLKNVPINKRSSGVHGMFSSHKDQAQLHRGGMIRDFASSNCFNGFYKVYDMTKPIAPEVWGFGSYDVTTQCMDKVGLIDSLGKLVLPIEHSVLIPVGDNILVSKDSVCGVIGYNWQPVVPVEYESFNFATSDDITFYKEEKIHLVYRYRENRMWAINGADELPLDAMWNVRHNPQPNRKAPLHFPFRKNMKYGLMDTAFNIITPASYEMIGWYSEGRMSVVRNKKYGYLDSTGKEVIPCRYDYAERFKDGIAVVQLDGKYININRNGKQVAFTRQHEAWRDRGNYKMEHCEIVWTMSGGYGVIDNKGKFTIPPIYDNISPVMCIKDRKRVAAESYFYVRDNNKIGVIDSAGNVVLPCEYELINDYPSRSGMRCLKKSDHEWGMVDKSWNIVVPCIYENVSTGYDWDYFIYVKHGLPKMRRSKSP